MAFPPDQTDSTVDVKVMKVFRTFIKWFKEGAYDWSADRLYAKKLNVMDLNAPSMLTIVSGAIAVKQMYHTIETSGGASTDLDTITATNCYAGDLLILRLFDSAHNVVLKHGTGNLKLTGGDVTLDLDYDTVRLMWTGAYWIKV